jgi:hypothetical protein
MRGTITILQPGEHVVRYRIRKDLRNDRWWGEMSASHAKMGKSEQPWVEWRSSASTTRAVG